nr:hypothetical protein [Tanacetum cinerariifolium]
VKVSKTKVRQEKDVEVESSKREGGSLEQEIAKKQKIEEETEELKKHLHIVTDDDDDDVYTYATPLALKIRIVDYKILAERNRPYFKIIRADGNHILQVEDESKMSLEFLRHVRRQLNEGAKTTSWNEFSSTMASVIICLATNQKFNFSRYILLNLVKNIEAGVPFFMFPKFVQLIINHQLDDMAYYKEIFDNPSLTKKVFANIKRVGILQADAQSIPITTEPSTSKPQKKHKPKRKHTHESEVLPTESPAEQNLPSPSNNPLPSGEDSLKLKELIDLCTNLSNKVLKLK